MTNAKRFALLGLILLCVAFWLRLLSTVVPWDAGPTAAALVALTGTIMFCSSLLFASLFDD